ncbi:MAG: alpha/beta hydrolase [Lachnospiraceae bacterium]|jgi:acetyl esterase/lipase|nr:alpha/beta hydrolase [Lachnospiraceae bacterium]
MNTHTYDAAGAPLHAYLLDQVSIAPGRVRPAVILCPGGGYICRSDREAEPVALQLAAMGCHTFILDYSTFADDPECGILEEVHPKTGLPDEKKPEQMPVMFGKALGQLAAAVALVRSRHEEWHIDPQRVFVMGFSAGAHLACSLGVYWNREVAKPKMRSAAMGPEVVQGVCGGGADGSGGISPGAALAARMAVRAKVNILSDDPKALDLNASPDADMYRPDGMILCYPVVSGQEGICHEGSVENLMGTPLTQEKRDIFSLELHVGAHTPPAFVWHTYADDAVPVENSLRLADAMRRAGVSLELHIFPEGCHGLSLANEETGGGAAYFDEPACQVWIQLLGTWIRGYA